MGCGRSGGRQSARRCKGMDLTASTRIVGLSVQSELSRTEVSWMIGGPQSGGINSSAELYGKALLRGGLSVFASVELLSNVIGKHCFYRVIDDPERLGP